MIDEFSIYIDTTIRKLKMLFVQGDYLDIFGFLQFVLRHENVPPYFTKQIDDALAQGRAAYRVFEESTIIPVGSDAEGATLERAFADLAVSKFSGARR
jgi:hypothetical protein